MGYNITASQYYNKPTTRAVVQPASAAALAAIVVHPVLERAVQSPASSDPRPAAAALVDVGQGAARSGSEVPTRAAKVVGLPRSQPLLFDNLLLFDVSLLGAHPTTLAPRLAQAGKDVPGGTPHPLLPLGFPFGAPPAGSTFGSSSGMGIGLDLLAVLALLLVLSRTGRSSVSPREGFKLVLVVGGALSLTLLVVLPRIAEAQDEDWASTGTKQSTAYEKASAPAMSGPATDPPARLVAKPGASLWSIAQERLGPGALPEQVAAETERIFELNRDRIGGNASLILPGQELLVTPVAGPSAAPDPAMAKPAVVELPSEPADDRPVVLAGSPEGEAMPAANSVEGLSVVGNFKEFDEETELERRLLGFGALALTLILVIVGAWRLPMRRNVEDPADWGIPTGYYYHANYTLPRAPKDAVDASDPGSGLPGARTLALAVSSGPGDEDSANGHDYIPDRSIEAKDPGSGRDDPGGQGTNGGPVTASPYPGDRRPKAHRHRSYSKGS